MLCHWQIFFFYLLLSINLKNKINNLPNVFIITLKVIIIIEKVEFLRS